MPRLKRRSVRARLAQPLDTFTLWQMCRDYGGFDDSEAQRQELEDTRNEWEPHAQEIIQSAARHCGCRPNFWWHFSCPASSRHLGEVYPFTETHFRERLRLLEDIDALVPGEREELAAWIHERERTAKQKGATT